MVIPETAEVASSCKIKVVSPKTLMFPKNPKTQTSKSKMEKAVKLILIDLETFPFMNNH